MVTFLDIYDFNPPHTPPPHPPPPPLSFLLDSYLGSVIRKSFGPLCLPPRVFGQFPHLSTRLPFCEVVSPFFLLRVLCYHQTPLFVIDLLSLRWAVSDFSTVPHQSFSTAVTPPQFAQSLLSPRLTIEAEVFLRIQVLTVICLH